MPKRKGVIQKILLISAMVTISTCDITDVFLYLQLDSVGSDNPILASLMISTFLFITVGITFNWKTIKL